MTILFFASELAGLSASDSNVKETTSSIAFQTPYSRAATNMPGSTTFALTPSFGAQSLLWTHFVAQFAPFPDYGNIYVEWLNAAGQVMVRMRYSGTRSQGLNSVLYLEYATAASGGGVTYAQLPSIPLNAESLQTFDLRITPGGGTRLYTGGFLRQDSVSDGGVASMPAISDIARVRWNGGGSLLGNANVSEVIVTNSEPTVGWRLLTDGATAAGALNSFSSSYANINEIVTDDSTYANSVTANDISTYAFPALAVNSFTVKAVGIGYRVKADTTGGPQNMQGVVRIAGTNYTQALTNALDVGYVGAEAIYPLNPATGLAWLPSEVSSAELGMKSLA